MVAGGQLCLTDSRRLGVTCTCHNQHMSVRSFTQVFLICMGGDEGPWFVGMNHRKRVNS